MAQPQTVPHEVAVNARAHAELVRLAEARVVLFPELSLTGYHYDAPPLDPAALSLTPLIEACAATRTLALAGAPVDGDGGGWHIALLAITGEGAWVAYRKTYLGGAELEHFSPGAPAALHVDGWRLGLAICKDTGVPEHAAATAALGMDVYAAAVLEAAEDVGVPEERARRVARDHGVWVAVASFAGSAGEGYRRAAGGSGIWRPDGSRAARAGSEVGELARATLTR